MWSFSIWSACASLSHHPSLLGFASVYVIFCPNSPIGRDCMKWILVVCSCRCPASSAWRCTFTCTQEMHFIILVIGVKIHQRPLWIQHRIGAYISMIHPSNSISHAESLVCSALLKNRFTALHACRYTGIHRETCFFVSCITVSMKWRMYRLRILCHLGVNTKSSGSL